MLKTLMIQNCLNLKVQTNWRTFEVTKCNLNPYFAKLFRIIRNLKVVVLIYMKYIKHQSVSNS